MLPLRCARVWACVCFHGNFCYSEKRDLSIISGMKELEASQQQNDVQHGSPCFYGILCVYVCFWHPWHTRIPYHACVYFSCLHTVHVFVSAFFLFFLNIQMWRGVWVDMNRGYFWQNGAAAPHCFPGTWQLLKPQGHSPPTPSRTAFEWK